MSKLFLCDYDEISPKSDFWRDRYLNRKNDGFWLLWGIFKEYIKQNIIMAVLRKANSYSVGLQIDKKINYVKEDPRRKID